MAGLAVGFAAIYGGKGAVAASIAASAQYHALPCAGAAGKTENLHCGRLRRPADGRADIELPVLHILPPEGARHLPPLVYIDGGPGSDSGLANPDEVRSWPKYAAQTPWLRDREVIVVPQRGTVGGENDGLLCRALGSLRIWAGASLSKVYFPDRDELTLRQIRRCKERAESRGAMPLDAISTHQMALDLKYLRQAMGIEKWDIYAVSYGARIALELIAADRAGVNRIALDSPDLPDSYGSFRTLETLLAKLDLLDRDCRRHPACHKAYGPIRDLFDKSMARLAANPETLPLRLEADDPPRYIRLDPERLGRILYNSFFLPGTIRYIPRALYRAERGDYGPLSILASSYYFDPGYRTIAYGVALSVNCMDFSAQRILEVNAEQTTLYPGLNGMLDDSYMSVETICPLWLGPDYKPEILNMPDLDGLRVFIAAGAYDPITPAKYARALAGRYEQATARVYPGRGHGLAGQSDCAEQDLADFLTGAPVRAACADANAVPDFIIDTSPTPQRSMIELHYGSGRLKSKR